MQRPQLVNDEIYHIVIRGVGDLAIFNNEKDYYRGIFSLYEFNTVAPIEIREQRKKRESVKAGKQLFVDERVPLIEVFAFFFMPNHIHLLLRQLKTNGISKFMKKVGTGYANYFNKKYKRRGHLFQGKFAAVHIKTNKQLQNVFVYIHTNGVSLIEPNWKEKGIRHPRKIIKFLESYKWSSYPDYLGKKNFPSVTKRDFLLKIMGGEKGYRQFVNDWIKHKHEISELKDIILE